MSKITITPQQLKEARGIAKELGVSSLHMNSKGEFFTNGNHAHFSEGGKKENTLELTAAQLVAEEAPAKEAKQEPTQEQLDAKKVLSTAKAALTNALKKQEKAAENDRAAAQEAVDAAQQAVDEAQKAYVAVGGTI